MRRRNNLIVYLIEIIYPLILLFGFYVVIYGDISPGGGFQGGAILASAFILRYVAFNFNKMQLSGIQTIEKFLYLLIVLIPFLSVITRGDALTNFLHTNTTLNYDRVFLILMNILVGLKVCLGITIIFYEFILHERRWSQ